MAWSTERVLPVPPDEEEHRGPRAHAADADDLARHVHEPVGPEEVTAVLVETLGVLVHELPDVLLLALRVVLIERVAQGNEQRGDAPKAELAVDPLGQLRDRPQAGLAPAFGEGLREEDPALSAEPATESVDQLTGVQPVVPDIEVALGGEAPHTLAVLPHAGRHEAAAPTGR